ncbi:hypothetical protein VTO42DRAFT_320 [Malbranchea cinnamomea]
MTGAEKRQQEDSISEGDKSAAESKPGVDELEKPVKIDTVHNDEALKVRNLARYQGDLNWDEKEEKHLARRIDRKLLPLLCLTYGLQYYDEAMLSHAAIFGLREDLNVLVGNRYSMTSSIFYLGFIAGAYPTMVLAQRFTIERVASADCRRQSLGYLPDIYSRLSKLPVYSGVLAVS